MQHAKIALLFFVLLTVAAPVSGIGVKKGVNGGSDDFQASVFGERYMSIMHIAAGPNDADGTHTVSPCAPRTWWRLLGPTTEFAFCNWPAGHRVRITEIRATILGPMDSGSEQCGIRLRVNDVDQSWSEINIDDLNISCDTSKLTAGKMAQPFDTCLNTDATGTILDAGDVAAVRFAESTPGFGVRCAAPFSVIVELSGVFL